VLSLLLMLSVYCLALSLQMSFQQMTWGRVNTYL
jgi:hypothetical protein